MTNTQIVPQSLEKIDQQRFIRLPEYKQMLLDQQRPMRVRFQRRVRKSLQTVTISFQGELIKTHCNSVSDRGDSIGGARAAIRFFSRSARKNMLETVSRMDWVRLRATFITLTYHEPVHDAKVCKNHLRILLKRLYRRYGEKTVLWRMDTQKRGCWHFHLIAFNLPYVPRTTEDGQGILNWWRDITGQPSIEALDIQLIRSAKKARSYCAKYVGKVGDEFTYLDYLANLPEALLPGRFWGIENRKLIPWAELTVWTIHARSEFSGYFDFKRAARQHWSGVNGSRFEGWTIFVRNIEAWERLLLAYCQTEYGAKRKGDG